MLLCRTTTARNPHHNTTFLTGSENQEKCRVSQTRFAQSRHASSPNLELVGAVPESPQLLGLRARLFDERLPEVLQVSGHVLGCTPEPHAGFTGRKNRRSVTTRFRETPKKRGNRDTSEILCTVQHPPERQTRPTEIQRRRRRLRQRRQNQQQHNNNNYHNNNNKNKNKDNNNNKPPHHRH